MLTETPEVVVARQLDAYNARDIDTFMACWAKDARVFAHPDMLLVQGHDDIRARHIIRFQEPDLFGRLISRVVLGARVVDTEVVTRNMEEGVRVLDVVAIYDVAEGLIQTAWFVTGAARLP